jgi:hypothetical protein
MMVFFKVRAIKGKSFKQSRKLEITSVPVDMHEIARGKTKPVTSKVCLTADDAYGGVEDNLDNEFEKF